MIEIRHAEGLNQSGAVLLALESYVEQMKAGHAGDELALHWDSNVILAVEKDRPIGVMIWTHEKHVKSIWLTLSHVVPDRRRQGIFKIMWTALVEKARENKAVQIQSMTSIHNIAMREAAARVGRVEDMVKLVYRVEPSEPPKPAAIS